VSARVPFLANENYPEHAIRTGFDSALTEIASLEDIGERNRVSSFASLDLDVTATQQAIPTELGDAVDVPMVVLSNLEEARSARISNSDRSDTFQP
jgi:hypothetical protein